MLFYNQLVEKIIDIKEDATPSLEAILGFHKVGTMSAELRSSRKRVYRAKRHEEYLTKRVILAVGSKNNEAIRIAISKADKHSETVNARTSFFKKLLFEEFPELKNKPHIITKKKGVIGWAKTNNYFSQIIKVGPYQI